MDGSPPGSYVLGFSRQEYWSGLPFPPQGDLPDPRIEPMSPESPALAGRVFTTAPPGNPFRTIYKPKILVTGASGGIGRAICLAAAKKGYYVIAHYNRGKEKAEETLRLIKDAGGKGELIQFDVLDRDGCKKRWSPSCLPTVRHGVL